MRKEFKLMKKLQRYENTICPIDREIFKDDEYTFYVLERISKGECQLAITDHERLIIFHSCSPFPVWVWLPDNATEVELNRAWEVIKENFVPNGEYGFNMKYSFAEYMIEKGKAEGLSLGITLNILTYNCLEPISPKRSVEGRCEVAQLEDIELATEFIDEFHRSVGIDKQDRERYRAKAEYMINKEGLFFWVDKSGKKVAMCSYNVEGDKACIGNVYTQADSRRKGYAANLVYAVTRRIKEQGKMPVIYTDADYIASNACYESIGYKLKGSLCTVGNVKEY